ncbi:Uncharacterised protein [uncultured archaeon]|nr:Uncharacterised protein [uncultured archaeon]
MNSASIISLFPYGTTTQAEVVSTIKSMCTEEDIQSLESIIAEWRGASKYFMELVSAERGAPESIDGMEIDAAYKPRLEKIASNAFFKRTFFTVPTEFKLVEIEKLVAPQKFVDLDYVQQLKETLPREPKMDDLINFCLELRQNTPPKKLSVAPNSFVYSSSNPDFRFLGGYSKPLTEDDVKASMGGMPAAAIVLLVGYGTPRCNALSIGKRMILNNGFHRMYALLDMGIKYAPLVIQKIAHPELEIAPEIIGVPREYLVRHPRPVMMKDFFDKMLVRVIHRKPAIKEVRISWNAQQSSVPI